MGPRFAPMWLCFGLLAWSGCGSLPQAPTIPSDDGAFQAAGPITPPGMEDDEPDALRVLPGDMVALTLVSEDTTEYKGLMVDERGLLHVPLAGDVRVGGLELARAEAEVEQALREFDRVVRVHMTLEALGGHNATVVGAVEEPGRFAVTPGTRVADLIALSAGVLDNDVNGEQEELSDLYGARVVRDGRVLPISVALAVEGHPRHNVRIRPGDHLYVPPVRQRRVSVLGEVRTPAVITYRSNLRLSEALSMAGGLSERADTVVHIVRGDLRAPLVYEASIQDIADGDSTDIVLAPGDVVYVDDHWFSGDLEEFLNVLSPILTLGLTAGVTYIITQ